MPGSESHRPQPALVLLILFALLVVLASSAQTAPTETQPKVQAPSALTKPSAPACPPPCLTPEQEAALVEVRKILQDAWEVATSIVPPTKPPGTTTPESRQTDLEHYKERLLTEIENARFRAGDFATAANAKSPWVLARAHIQYGHLAEAVEAATRKKLIGETWMILDALIEAGDFSGALKVAEAQIAKESLEFKRNQAQAELLAYLARFQAEANQSDADATLRRAISAARALQKYPSYQYPSLVAVACAESRMGNRSASTESFRQALQVARTLKEARQGRSEEREGRRADVVTYIASAWAKGGDREESREAFEEAGRLIGLIQDPTTRVSSLRYLAKAQINSGFREKGLQTVQQAIQAAEMLPTDREKRLELTRIAELQGEIGEQEAQLKTMEREWRLRDPASALLAEAQLLAERNLFKQALDRVDAMTDGHDKVSILSSVAYWLVKTKDPFGTPEVMQQLAKSATALLPESLLQAGGVDRKTRKQYYSVANIQAAAGDVAGALRTIERISSDASYGFSYQATFEILISKGDLAGAERVVAVALEKQKPGPLLFMDELRTLAKAYATGGEVKAGLALAQKQVSPYGKAAALLGVAEGVMDQRDIRDIVKLFRWMHPGQQIMSRC